MLRVWFVLLLLAPALSVWAQAQTAQPTEAGAPAATLVSASESVCLMIESAARANGLPLEFFARVIWQESRFRPDAIGPRTRTGEHAQGIAQFMPRTAAERGLLDPLDPVQALPKSAEFLRALRGEFGNLGLAAAAYNAGPQRVRDWLAGSGSMPAETRSYVAAITGASLEDWRDGKDADRALGPAPGCRELIALLKRAPNPFVEELQRRVTLGAAKIWGVQLSAGFSRERALASYAAAARRFAGVLAGRDPSILAGRLRSRGTRTFYQVRVGADTRGAAEDLCGKLRRAGGACLVLRNPRGAG
jgi:Transglycosylase SLT domain/SPOR domain